jgi:hypothetical protein
MKRKLFMIVLIVMAAQVISCSKGHLKYNDTLYILNESDMEIEDDGRYRVQAWRYESSALLEFFGRSPAGLQLLLPSDIEQGGSCEIPDECYLWVRKDWLLGITFESMWTGADSGSISFTEWDDKTGRLRGTFEAETEDGPVSGDFKARLKEERTEE